MASSSRQKSGSSGSRGASKSKAVKTPRASKTTRTVKTSRTTKTSSAAKAEAKLDTTPAKRIAQQSEAPSFSEFESKTIGSLRLERERRKQAARKQERIAKEKRKSNLPFIIVGAVLFLAASFLAMYFILINTNVFEIDEVEILGTDHLTKQEVSALVVIPQGTTLLNVDAEGIENSLSRDAWIEDVSVQRIFPNKLDIYVTERKIGAVVEIPTGINQAIQDWAISNDGIWLMPIPERNSEVGKSISEQIYIDAEQALHIDGVPYGITPKIGEYCTDENVNNALNIISDMTTELADQLKSVTATDAESTLLTLKSNVEIAFGSASDIREKERICLKIMADNPKVVYINVRTPDRPTWRSA